MVLVKILNLIFGLGMSRYGLALNKSSHETMKVFDKGFSRGVKALNRLGLKESLEKVGSFFGWVTLIYLVFFFIGKALIGDGAWQLYGSLVSICSAFIWISIKWFTSFQKLALDFLFFSIKIFSTILLLPVLDFLGRENMTELFYNQLNSILSMFFGVGFPELDNSIYQAGVIFIFYSLIILIYWLISTLYFGIITLLSLGIVGSVVYFARILDRYWSENHLTGFFVVGFVITSIVLFYG